MLFKSQSGEIGKKNTYNYFAKKGKLAKLVLHYLCLISGLDFYFKKWVYYIIC